jgi:epoxyqueuosine reductase
MTLKQAIENEAYALGFCAFGVADAKYDPVPHGKFQRWLERGFHGSMKYLERETRKRFDPKQHLPGAKSVMVCAHNYYSSPKIKADKPYISIYARGENYHRVLKDKLEILNTKIIQFSGGKISSKICVDSESISEKSFAVKAGGGFIGRNGLLIIPKKASGTETGYRGSFHFLGLIITDLSLEPDFPIPGNCGQCRKCVEACPTGAILENGLIDAGRCISYHTTQNKADIPDYIAKGMGNMVFGCDICQIVCPYNNKPVVSNEPRFRPDPRLVDIDIQKLSSLNEDDFGNYFGLSSLAELKYPLFLRNLSIIKKNLTNLE